METLFRNSYGILKPEPYMEPVTFMEFQTLNPEPQHTLT